MSYSSIILLWTQHNYTDLELCSFAMHRCCFPPMWFIWSKTVETGLTSDSKIKLWHTIMYTYRCIYRTKCNSILIRCWIAYYSVDSRDCSFNPFSAGTAFMLMQTGWIQASRRVTRRLAWDPTRLLLSLSFRIKNKQNLKVLKSRRQYNLFLENYPAFKGLNIEENHKRVSTICPYATNHIG